MTTLYKYPVNKYLIICKNSETGEIIKEKTYEANDETEAITFAELECFDDLEPDLKIEFTAEKK
jgi:hypothetical protein